jgi:hypothetical protein
MVQGSCPPDGSPGETMKLILYNYICQNCNNVIKAPALVVFGYGPLLLRSTGDNNQIAMITVLDPVGDEVEDLLNINPDYAARTQDERSSLFQSVIGEIACDPDKAGCFYQVKEPKCTNCHIQEITQYRETIPSEFIESEVPEVTHALWNTLSEQEKIRKVKNVLYSRINGSGKRTNA